MRLTPKKGRGVGTYLMIGVLLVAALIFLLPNLKGSSKEPEYSEIIQYFDDYEVTEYTLDLGSGELEDVAYSCREFGLGLVDGAPEQ